MEVNERGFYEGVINGRKVELARVTHVIGEFLENWEAVPKHNLEKAARFGTKVHTATEYYDKGELNLRTIDIEIWPSVRAWIDFLKDFDVKIEAIEPAVYNVRHGFAGRLDRVGLVKGVMSIIDIKTCKYKSVSHDLQVAAYQGAWNQLNPKKKALKRYLVELKRDGTYQVTEIKGAGDYAIFLSAVALYNWKVSHG